MNCEVTIHAEKNVKIDTSYKKMTVTICLSEIVKKNFETIVFKP